MMASHEASCYSFSVPKQASECSGWGGDFISEYWEETPTVFVIFSIIKSRLGQVCVGGTGCRNFRKQS